MSGRKISFLKHISVFIFALILVMSLLFIAVTYVATQHFHQASTQRLNKEVAAHIAKFTSPFEEGGINKQKADSVFYNAMVVNPTVEVYFLDITGKVIYYQAPDSAIKTRYIPLTNIQEHILAGGETYTKGPDPKDPTEPKVFSAAEVKGKTGKLGYIYVILGSNEYRNVSDLLFDSYAGQLALQAFIIILVASVIFSFLYLRRLQRKFKRINQVLLQFQKGNLAVRLDQDSFDELSPITQAFNQMADQLLYHINRLKKSESERKSFIANISHDLRTPLSVARGYTETLLWDQQKSLNSGQQPTEYLQLILNKILQVEEMVLQLFELSKLDSVAYTLHKEPFIVAEVLEEIIKSARISAAKKNIQLDCIGCQDTAFILADVRMMERAMQNLIDNTLKYTAPHGRIIICLEKKQNKLELHMENTGEPLPAELLEWINDNQDENNNFIRQTTTGLGLAIVKKILTMHNFAFKAKNNSGLGNCFIFRMDVYIN